MVELDDTVPENVATETEDVSALTDDETPDFDAAQPMICDSVIGFVCPKRSAL